MRITFRPIIYSLVINLGLLGIVCAEQLELEHPRGEIIIPKIKGWELAKDVFGMPYMYFSPKKNGQKSNISLTHSGTKFPFRPSEIEDSTKEYQKLKNKWAQKVGAEVLGFDSYKKSSNLLNHVVHQFSFTYQFKGSNYKETSYYIDCFDEMLFVKSLRLIENKNHESEFNKIVDQLNCSSGDDP